MVPLQHIHPMLVHFPIVLIMVLAVFDVIATVRGLTVSGRTISGSVSTSIAVAAAVFSVLAYIFGGIALTIAESGGFHSNVAEIHEQLGETVAISFSVYAVLRIVLWMRDYRTSGAMTVILPAIAVIGSVLVGATAYFGGQLVYDLGVNVAKVAMN